VTSHSGKAPSSVLPACCWLPEWTPLTAAASQPAANHNAADLTQTPSLLDLQWVWCRIRSSANTIQALASTSHTMLQDSLLESLSASSSTARSLLDEDSTMAVPRLYLPPPPHQPSGRAHAPCSSVLPFARWSCIMPSTPWRVCAERFSNPVPQRQPRPQGPSL
jgi:hypothetical protein